MAVWGCGPVGQFAIQRAWMFGAARVIAIDRVPERMAMAAVQSKVEVIDFPLLRLLIELAWRTLSPLQNISRQAGRLYQSCSASLVRQD